MVNSTEPFEPLARSQEPGAVTPTHYFQNADPAGNFLLRTHPSHFVTSKVLPTTIIFDMKGAVLPVVLIAFLSTGMIKRLFEPEVS